MHYLIWMTFYNVLCAMKYLQVKFSNVMKAIMFVAGVKFALTCALCAEHYSLEPEIMQWKNSLPMSENLELL